MADPSRPDPPPPTPPAPQVERQAATCVQPATVAVRAQWYSVAGPDNHPIWMELDGGRPRFWVLPDRPRVGRRG